MAAVASSLGNLDILPPEILQRILDHTHETDDHGVSGKRLELIHSAATNTLHHYRANDARIKQIGASFMESHRALCLVNKRMHHEAEEVLFRNTTVAIFFGQELANYFNPVFLLSHRNGKEPVSLKYLAERLRHLKLFRFVPLPKVANQRHQTAYWIKATLFLPKASKAADPVFTSIRYTRRTGEPVDQALCLAQETHLEEEMVKVFGWTQALQPSSTLTAENLAELIATWLEEDDEMDQARRLVERKTAKRIRAKEAAQRLRELRNFWRLAFG